ncbi:MAG TPA: response regulator [Ramlibacter sp.]|uniref:response regulator n=1 Tax=Ramlibacter sp. TaxID=1917967 RepID=UPI002D7E8720|nr:response regulator [Ramlibacter sp.]HET8747081.1 response regulator [Ramlibacter sp.]
MTALRRLLVVDDDPVVGASFKRVLSGKGYLVVAAENGQEALERLNTEKFDAVFTDLRMPGIDGLQVAEKIRAAQPWTPVVIVTGYGSPASEARARAAGVSEFLHKPLSPEMIEDSAEKAVRTVPEGQAAPREEPDLAVSPTAMPASAVPAAEAPAQGGPLRMLRNMALFLAAPFIGLLYAVLLPFVGLGMLAWVAIKGKSEGEAAEAAAAAPTAPAEPAIVEAAAVIEPMAPIAAEPENRGIGGAAKVAAGIVAAPFLGLAWIVLAPFAGLAALAWMAAKSVFVRAS